MPWKTDLPEKTYTFRFGGIIKTIMEFVPGGILRAGKTAYDDNTNAGWWIGIDSDGLPKINVGNSSVSFKWTGTTAQYSGDGSGLTAINGGNITTGTVTTDAIAAGAVTAAKISVSNLAAVNTNTGNLAVSGTLTAGTGVKDSTLDGYALDSGEIVLQVDGGDILKMNETGITVAIPTNNLLAYAIKWLHTALQRAALSVYHSSYAWGNQYSAYWQNDASVGDTQANCRAYTEIQAGSSTNINAHIELYASSGPECAASIQIDADADATPATKITLNAAQVAATTAYLVGVNQVVGAQQAAIADITVAGTAQDGDARTKLNAILAALRAHGLIAT